MQHFEIQERLARIASLSGDKTAYAAITMTPEAVALTVYPNGFGNVASSLRVADTDTESGTVSEMFGLAEERLTGQGPAIIEAMALDIINMHFKTGAVSAVDLRRKHGDAVAKYALRAVVLANERMCPQQPIVISDYEVAA